MSRYKPANVSSKYGAPMGRYCAPRDPVQEPYGRCRLVRVPLVEGCYDQGGAYWGGPDNLWVCLAEDGAELFFVRGADRAAAYASVVKALGPVRLHHGIPYTRTTEF